MTAPAQAVTTVTVPVGETALAFRVRQGLAGPAFFSLGVRKSGSTMLHKIVNFLAIRNDVTLVDVPGTFFRNGFTVQTWAEMDLSALLAPGNLYSGFRAFPAGLAATPLYAEARKVFLYRDPRDALVSQYFSDAYSHELPKAEVAGDGRDLFLKKRAEAQGADIDGWVLAKAGGIRRTMLAYRAVLADPLCLRMRYEDYVLRKHALIDAVLGHFGWRLSAEHRAEIIAHIDVVPETEDKLRFIRRVIPGDHIDKLRPETIRALDGTLAEVLELYDYR